MGELLQPSQALATDSGGSCQVEKFLGSGGQGEVYQARWEGKPFALKWYFPDSANAGQLRSLQTLVHKGPPSARFLWPLELLSNSGFPGFGYLMQLRGPRFKGVIDIMKRRVEPSFRALATAGFGLAESFLDLHAKGLCYCDISWGNVFLDPDTGEVAICDNDNVIVNGQKPTIAGTPYFMAPEVVRAEALPSIETDKFSLAVLLFYLFFVDHPLKGKKEAAIRAFDLPAMNKLFGTEPLYIFDPSDSSNAPVAGLHDNAIAFQEVYPTFLKKLFEKAFTTGLRDPQHGRVTENEWRSAMVRLRDSIVYCRHCGAENFYDAEAMQAGGGKPVACWSCAKDVVLPFRIRINKAVSMLNHDSKLYPHHVDDGRLFDFSGPVAEVVRHPQNPGIWGLKNLSSEKWVVIAQDGTAKDVEPGKSAPLASGSRINFGKVEGDIRY